MPNTHDVPGSHGILEFVARRWRSILLPVARNLLTTKRFGETEAQLAPEDHASEGQAACHHRPGWCQNGWTS
jgi:hypothetical protein